MTKGELLSDLLQWGLVLIDEETTVNGEWKRPPKGGFNGASS